MAPPEHTSDYRPRKDERLSWPREREGESLVQRAERKIAQNAANGAFQQLPVTLPCNIRLTDSGAGRRETMKFNARSTTPITGMTSAATRASDLLGRDDRRHPSLIARHRCCCC